MLHCLLTATLLVSYVQALSIPTSPSVLAQPLESGNPATPIIDSLSASNDTFPSNAAVNNTTDLGVGQLTAGSSICLPKEKTRLRRPVPRPRSNDCALALRQFSSDPTVEDFCTIPGRAPQGCLIPITKTVESCTVTVEIAGYGRTEKVSWLEIGMAANQLNMGCFSMDGAWAGTTGGTTNAGKTSRIQIKLANSGNAGVDPAPVY